MTAIRLQAIPRRRQVMTLHLALGHLRATARQRLPIAQQARRHNLMVLVWKADRRLFLAVLQLIQAHLLRYSQEMRRQAVHLAMVIHLMVLMACQIICLSANKRLIILNPPGFAVAGFFMRFSLGHPSSAQRLARGLGD